MFTIPYVSCVTCHVSRIMCHVSSFTCHMSHFTCKRRKKKKKKMVKLVGGGSVINGAYPVQFIHPRQSVFSKGYFCKRSLVPPDPSRAVRLCQTQETREDFVVWEHGTPKTTSKGTQMITIPHNFLLPKIAHKKIYGQVYLAKFSKFC